MAVPTPNPPQNEISRLFEDHLAHLQAHLRALTSLATHLTSSGLDPNSADIAHLTTLATQTHSLIEETARTQQRYLHPPTDTHPPAPTSPRAQPETRKRQPSPRTSPPAKKPRRQADGPATRQDHANPYPTLPSASPVEIEREDISALVNERLRLRTARRAKRLDEPDSVRAPPSLLNEKRKRLSNGSTFAVDEQGRREGEGDGARVPRPLSSEGQLRVARDATRSKMLALATDACVREPRAMAKEGGDKAGAEGRAVPGTLAWRMKMLRAKAPAELERGRKLRERLDTFRARAHAKG